MSDYLNGIWNARHFWRHLAQAELRYKFRRSKLGIIWTMIYPLLLTAMMAVVFGSLFKQPVREFAPYVFSGLLTWEFLVSSVIGGCQSLLVSEAYIKQYKHPFAIYPLKTNMVNIYTFLLALPGLALWILFIRPANLLVGLLAMPLSILLIFMLGWPIVLIVSFLNLKYRDFGQVSGLLMQLIWYGSPVFYDPKMLNSPTLIAVLELNPVTHILNLVRAPMLYGQFPALMDYAFVLATMLFFYLLALFMIWRSEKTLIYYF